MRLERDARREAERRAFELKQLNKRLRKEAAPLWRQLQNGNDSRESIAIQLAAIDTLEPAVLDFKDVINGSVSAIHIAAEKERVPVLEALLDARYTTESLVELFF